MAMKQFHVGIKAVIKNDRGVLFIKHARGYWDFPGGRIDDNEDFKQTLLREINEELPGTEDIDIQEVLGAHRVDDYINDDLGLVLIYYHVMAKVPEPILLSHEHTEYLWVDSKEMIPEDCNSTMREITENLLK